MRKRVKLYIDIDRLLAVRVRHTNQHAKSCIEASLSFTFRGGRGTQSHRLCGARGIVGYFSILASGIPLEASRKVDHLLAFKGVSGHISAKKRIAFEVKILLAAFEYEEFCYIRMGTCIRFEQKLACAMRQKYIGFCYLWRRPMQGGTGSTFSLRTHETEEILGMLVLVFIERAICSMLKFYSAG